MADWPLRMMAASCSPIFDSIAVLKHVDLVDARVDSVRVLRGLDEERLELGLREAECLLGVVGDLCDVFLQAVGLEADRRLDVRHLSFGESKSSGSSSESDV